MAMTLASSSAPYLTPSEFAAFQDVNAVGMLVRDDGTKATLAQLVGPPADNYLMGVLLAASGELEASVLIGSRYRVEDLNALLGVNPVTGFPSAGGMFLKRLIASIAMKILMDRRDGPMPENVEGKYKEAQEFLGRLRSGEAVFSLAEAEKAGLPTVKYFTPADLRMNGLLSGNTRQFGNRSIYKSRNGIVS
jgi:hypothetical protein